MYKIFKSTIEDAQQGWVWLRMNSLPPRSIVKLTNTETKMSAYCEVLQIDENFMRFYNNSPRLRITSPASSIVINDWYRKKLGIDTQTEVELVIVPKNNPWGRYWACAHHPQIIVRLATRLGVISVVLGAIGVLLGILSLWPKSTCT